MLAYQMLNALRISVLVHLCPVHNGGVPDLHLGHYTLTPKIIQIRIRKNGSWSGKTY